MTKDQKAKIIHKHLIPEGEGFTCLKWEKFGFINKPTFKTQFEGQLMMAHQLRFYDKNF